MSKDMQKNERERVQSRPSATPRVDVFENKDEVLLLADLPGVTQDGLKLHLDEEQLDLEGQTPSFDYRRSFYMPQGTDRERVSAELKNGVLWLHLPKSPAIKPRRIEVKGG
jgi:HSP20 family molecular chaperone IbpA